MIDLNKRILFFSNLGFFNIKKLSKKSTLFFLDLQKRIERVANKSRVFLTTHPFPYRKKSSLVGRDRSIDMRFYIRNDYWKSVKSPYPRVEDYGRFSLILIDTEVPISIEEASEPFPEIFIWDTNCRDNNLILGEKRWFFQTGNIRNSLLTIRSSIFPRLIKIFSKSVQLVFFNNRELFDRVNKIKTKFNIGSQSPGPGSFSSISLPRIYLSTKSFLKEYWDIFISHFCRDKKMASFRERNVPFSVKKTSKILHNSTWFGKLHFTKYNNCPQRLTLMERGSNLRCAIV